MPPNLIRRDSDGKFTAPGAGGFGGSPRQSPTPHFHKQRGPPGYADSEFDLPLGPPGPRPPWMMGALPPMQPTKERGRWVDLVVAAVLLALGIVRAVTALSTEDIDALGAIQALIWALVALLVAAPELNRFSFWDLSFATRSSLFDRGILFIVAGISNLTVEWQLIGSDTAGEETTKAPSYIFGASVSLTGVVYVVVHAKNFNKQGAMPAAPFHGMGMPPFPPPMGPHGPITPGRPGYRGPQPEKGFPWPPPPSSARTVGTRISADSEKSASSYSRPTTPKHSPRGKTKPSRRPPPSTDTDFARSTRAPAPSTFVA